MIPERPRNLVLQELARVDRAAFAQLTNHLEACSLQRGDVHGTPRLAAEFSHFIDSGVVALLASTRAGHTVEIAAMGREGVQQIPSSEQRFARWLLCTAERANTNRFEFTHEFVAQMVGAPRSAVSATAAALRARASSIIDAGS